ncbi:tetratricopeptide repeat protein [Chungangia koreensis]|uniref:Tetratricopeptide repeat protein n=1 Tax=Chungangia koreensis TaxID=752657 RepID=A0ABV8X3X0_9LACT
MRKKYGKLQKKDNVIVFPGTFERLLAEGLQLVGDFKYADSLELLEQALSLEPDHPNVLGAYAFALYETGNFKKAKEICKRLLQLGPPHYIEAMELYLTTLIQLREFEEVRTTIAALFEEGHIPEERKERFRHLLGMSERITTAPVSEIDPDLDSSLFEVDRFSALHNMEQEQLLMRLNTEGIQEYSGQLAALVEHEKVPAITKTIILLQLMQSGYDELVSVNKFGYEGDIAPFQLSEPDEMPKFTQCMTLAVERLEKDPSKEEMVADLLFRHAFAMYPFEWPDFEPDEIVPVYIGYVEQLLGGPEVPHNELKDFIERIEMMYYERG